MAKVIGFTGTQAGLSEYQKRILEILFVPLVGTDWRFIHGNCIKRIYKNIEIIGREANG
jgi:hypothetical protein